MSLRIKEQCLFKKNVILFCNYYSTPIFTLNTDTIIKIRNKMCRLQKNREFIFLHIFYFYVLFLFCMLWLINI